MIKAAFQKWFVNKVWLYFGTTILISFFIYGYVSSMDVSEETVWMAIITVLIIGGFPLFLALCQMAGAFFKILALQKWLNRLPVFVRERLESDFQLGDRIADFYFTNAYLVVFQLRGGKQEGMVCIPCEEIQEVRVKPDTPNRIFLEICRIPGLPSHYVFVQGGADAEMVLALNRKIVSMRSQMEPVQWKDEEQKRAEEKAEKKNKKSPVDPGVILLVLDFAGIMLYFSLMAWAENCFEKVKNVIDGGFYGMLPESFAKQTGRLLFWPNLLVYLVMYGVPLILLAGAAFYIHKGLDKIGDRSPQWKGWWKTAAFTILAALFILFVGLIYSSDVNTVERIAQGYRMLVGG